MTGLSPAPEWIDPSGDPNDETFGGTVEPATLADADDYDAVLVGEPFDGAVLGRPGASEGPAALREALAGVKTHHFDAGPVGSVADLGDVALPEAAAGPDPDVAAVQAAVAEVAGAVHAADAFPVFLGGDNSLTVGNVGALLADDWPPERGLPTRSVGVVNLDAHLDVRAVREGPTSGTPYRQLFDAGLHGYAPVGVRHFETSTAYHDVLRDHGGEAVTAEEVGADPIEAGRRALDALGDVDAVYLSLDLDVLDAAAAPGVSAPTPGGLSTRECFRLLRYLAGDERVAGFEVVECAPPLDEGGRTAAAGARAVAHVLAGVGARA